MGAGVSVALTDTRARRSEAGTVDTPYKFVSSGSADGASEERSSCAVVGDDARPRIIAHARASSSTHPTKDLAPLRSLSLSTPLPRAERKALARQIGRCTLAYSLTNISASGSSARANFGNLKEYDEKSAHETTGAGGKTCKDEAHRRAASVLSTRGTPKLGSNHAELRTAGSTSKAPRRPRPPSLPPTKISPVYPVRNPPRPAGKPPPAAKRCMAAPFSLRGEECLTEIHGPVTHANVHRKAADSWRARQAEKRLSSTFLATEVGDEVDADSAFKEGSGMQRRRKGSRCMGNDPLITRPSTRLLEEGVQVKDDYDTARRQNALSSSVLAGESASEQERLWTQEIRTRDEDTTSTTLTPGGHAPKDASTSLQQEDYGRVPCNQGCRSQQNDAKGSLFVDGCTSHLVLEPAPGQKSRRSPVEESGPFPAKDSWNALVNKEIIDWTAWDVRAWVKALPGDLALFGDALAFSNGSVDGKRLARLTLADLKKRDFHHKAFDAKIPVALWKEIKRIQPANRMVSVEMAPRFAAGQIIIDEAVRAPICTVTRFVGQGAFGEVYEVVWTDFGKERGTTMAMKAVRLADFGSDKRDDYRVLLLEEILTAVRVKPHPNVVNVRFAHIMGFCTDEEEYFCFEDFAAGHDLADVIAGGDGMLYNGTPAEVQGRLLSYSIQIARGLAHIHRCGILHQDVKPANIMVDNNGRLLLTDFGLSVVGQFGPPRPRSSSSPSSKGSPSWPERHGGDMAVAGPDGGCTSEGAGTFVSDTSRSRRARAPGLKDNTTAISKSSHGHKSKIGREALDAELTRGEGRKCCGQALENGPSPSCALYGSLRGFTPGYQSPEICAIVRERDDAKARSSPDQRSQVLCQVLATKDAVRFECRKLRVLVKVRVCIGFIRPRSQFGEAIARETPIHRESRRRVLVSTSPTPAPAVTLSLPYGNIADTLKLHARRASAPLTHHSDMWAAGVIILELYAGTMSGLPGGRGENAQELLENLVTDASVCEKASGIKAHSGRRRVEKRQSARSRVASVPIPGGVAALLRQVFKQDVRDRPASMEVVAGGLSSILADKLKNGLAIVPCLTADAPSPDFLCEERPVAVCEDANLGKIGRLHIWLGKALSLKGEARRDQALEEYRQGISLLEQSKADQGSPSMALFRWYLGKALLEIGEAAEALPHLVEAASINPENAKYRHMLGMAKQSLGDEAGAQVELLEAALLEEKDAEQRYQLRMERRSAAAASGETVDSTDDVLQRVLSSTSEGGDRQGATAIEPDTKESIASRMLHSQRRALEEAVCTRTCALDGLLDYRKSSDPQSPENHRGDDRSSDDRQAGSGNGHTDLHRDETLANMRRHAVGDKIICQRRAIPSTDACEPLICHPPPLPHGNVSGIDGMFVIDGFLNGQQASMCFPGEAYAARLDLDPSDESSESVSCGSHNVIHVRIRSNDGVPQSLLPDSSGAEQAVSTVKGANHGVASGPTSCSQQRASTADSHASTPGGTASEKVFSRPREALHVWGTAASSATSRRFLQAKLMQCVDFASSLKAVGRAAMVGFHSALTGAIVDFKCRPNELYVVSTTLSSECWTLREVLRGRFYRSSANDEAGGAKGAEDSVVIVVSRMLTLAKQTAAALAHCHRAGVLLQDITPDEVFVTPDWQTKLRPKYTHARDDRDDTAALRRESQGEGAAKAAAPAGGGKCEGARVARQRGGNKCIVTPFSNTTPPDYQSPEIASMRKARPLSTVVAERFSRRSDLSRSPTRPRAIRPMQQRQSKSDSVETSTNSEQPSGVIIEEERTATLEDVKQQNRASIDPTTQKGSSPCPAADRAADLLPVEIDHGIRSNTGSTSSCSPPSRPSADDVGVVESAWVTPCTSDTWAWALIVLEMFSDERWPPGAGEDGLAALEALLSRKPGVHTWSTEDVLSWTRETGLWTAEREREIRALRVAGPQLLVPLSRRDVVEKLGLFLADADASRILWKDITGRLQRWPLPRILGGILTRCFASQPEDRFTTMDEVCDALHDVKTELDDSEACPSSAPSMETDTEERRSSEDVRTAKLLNNVGANFSSLGLLTEAERYYKRAMLRTEHIPEPHYNLGLIYMRPAFERYQMAQHEFESASGLFEMNDLRRRMCTENAKIAGRKSNYYQSPEVMNALSGKYRNLPNEGKRGSATTMLPKDRQSIDAKAHPTRSTEGRNL